MTYLPKVGKAATGDRAGKTLIVTAGDRITLAGMLAHGWPEVELETDRPENGRILESYAIKGWPTFVLIAPGGTIVVRGFSDAFFEAKRVLDRELGGESAD